MEPVLVKAIFSSFMLYFVVIQKSTKAGYNLSREHRNSSSTDNGYFSFVDSKDKQASVKILSNCSL
jgi:hypothetical protein